MGQKLIWKAFHDTRRPKGLVNANAPPARAKARSPQNAPHKKIAGANLAMVQTGRFEVVEDDRIPKVEEDSQPCLVSP